MGSRELARRGVDNLIQNHLRLSPGERTVLFHLGDWPALALLREGLAAAGAAVHEVDARSWTAMDEPTHVAALEDALAGATASLYASPDTDAVAGDAPQRLVTTIERLGSVRHLHVPKVGERTLSTCLRADPELIGRLNARLAEALDGAAALTVRSGAGTDLRVALSATYPLVTDLGVPEPGSWSGVPTGAITFFSRDVSGTYVADRIASGSGFRIASRDLERRPLQLRLERSRLREHGSDDPMATRTLDEHLARDPNANLVGFVSLSTNYLARSPIGTFSNDAMLPGLRIMLGYSNPQRTRAPLSAEVWATFLGRQQDVLVDGLPIVERGRFARTFTRDIVPF